MREDLIRTTHEAIERGELFEHQGALPTGTGDGARHRIRDEIAHLLVQIHMLTRAHEHLQTRG